MNEDYFVEGYAAEDYDVVANIPRGLTERSLQITAYTPKITKRDMQRGSIERYFVRQINTPLGEITEVSKQGFDAVRDVAFYSKVQLTWRITGNLEDVAGPASLHGATRTYTGVITANRVAVEEADRQLSGMRNRLRNYRQYWIAM